MEKWIGPAGNGVLDGRQAAERWSLRPGQGLSRLSKLDKTLMLIYHGGTFSESFNLGRRSEDETAA